MVSPMPGNEKSIWHNLQAVREDHVGVLVERDGKTLRSTLVPMVQAVFLEHAIVRNIGVRIALQVGISLPVSWFLLSATKDPTPCCDVV